MRVYDKDTELYLGDYVIEICLTILRIIAHFRHNFDLLTSFLITLTLAKVKSC